MTNPSTNPPSASAAAAAAAASPLDDDDDADGTFLSPSASYPYPSVPSHPRPSRPLHPENPPAAAGGCVRSGVRENPTERDGVAVAVVVVDGEDDVLDERLCEEVYYVQDDGRDDRTLRFRLLAADYLDLLVPFLAILLFWDRRGALQILGREYNQ